MFSLKVFVFAMVAVILVVTGQQTDKAPVEILTENSILKEDGYEFGDNARAITEVNAGEAVNGRLAKIFSTDIIDCLFKTSDGISRQEEAELITMGEHKGIGVKGSYSYIAPDGVEYVVSYTADDKGFKPTIRVVNPGI